MMCEPLWPISEFGYGITKFVPDMHFGSLFGSHWKQDRLTIWTQEFCHLLGVLVYHTSEINSPNLFQSCLFAPIWLIWKRVDFPRSSSVKLNHSLTSWSSSLVTRCKIALRWIPQSLDNEKSTQIFVVTRPQWVKMLQLKLNLSLTPWWFEKSNIDKHMDRLMW